MKKIALVVLMSIILIAASILSITTFGGPPDERYKVITHYKVIDDIGLNLSPAQITERLPNNLEKKMNEWAKLGYSNVDKFSSLRTYAPTRVILRQSFSTWRFD